MSINYVIFCLASGKLQYVREGPVVVKREQSAAAREISDEGRRETAHTK